MALIALQFASQPAGIELNFGLLKISDPSKIATLQR